MSCADATPSARIRVGGAPLDVTAVHAPHPTAACELQEWRATRAAVPDARALGPVQVVLGDLNAKLDQPDLRSAISRGYRDAADDSGAGLTMTWPTNRAMSVIAIDHVLVEDRARVDDFEAVKVAGTDYKAVIARLDVPAP